MLATKSPDNSRQPSFPAATPTPKCKHGGDQDCSRIDHDNIHHLQLSTKLTNLLTFPTMSQSVAGGTEEAALKLVEVREADVVVQQPQSMIVVL
jgi:hypothetical protein